MSDRIFLELFTTFLLCVAALGGGVFALWLLPWSEEEVARTARGFRAAGGRAVASVGNVVREARVATP